MLTGWLILKKILIISIIIIIMSSTFVSANNFSNNKINKSGITQNQGFINITAQEAWDLMNSSDDGRQIPIDIRRWDEYSSERIETPNQEDWPRWFPYEFTSGGPGPIKNEGLLLKLFINIYQNKEIIIYCRTGRRTGISAQILIDNGYTGTLYNMVDGITEWKLVGLPTVNGF
jgi:rhodanese-related sulfurtransferase